MKIKRSPLVSAACFLAAIFQLVPNAHADVLNSWAIKQLTPTNPLGIYYRFDVTGIAYGNNRYVAVGKFASTDYGAIVYSSDGLNWNYCVPPAGVTNPNPILNLYDVAYGNGKFVAVGYWGSICTSSNGIDWTTQFVSPAVNNLFGVAYGNGIFVAVGDDIYTSVDGDTWVPRQRSGTFYSVAFGNGKFMTVAPSTVSYISDNGQTWSLLSGPSPVNINSKVVFANGRFMVSGGFGTNWMCPPSSTSIPPSPFPSWYAVTFGNSLRVDGISYRDGFYIGSGFSTALGTNLFLRSIDGTNWLQESFRHPYTVRKLVPDGPRVVGVGTSSSESAALAADFFFMTALRGSSAEPWLKIAGSLGRSCVIDYASTLPTNGDANWQLLTNFVLTNSPYFYADSTWTNSPSRFYLGRLQ